MAIKRPELNVRPKYELLRLKDLCRWQKLGPPVKMADLERWTEPARQLIGIPTFSVKRGIPIIVSANSIVHPAPYLDRISRIIKVYPEGEQLIMSAFRLAWAGHSGQFRKSGEPYIEHPIAVAEIVAEWGLGPEEIAAALCHDLIEDGKLAGERVTREFISRELGERVAALIEGITEFGKEPEFIGEKPGHVEVFKKLLDYGAKDVASIFIKLADRLHNMRTLVYMSEEAKNKKADETLHVYARLADRMGMWELKRELEDLSFSYLEPQLYSAIEAKREELVAQSKEKVGQIVNTMQKRLDQTGLRIEVVPELRFIYELKERMRERKIELEDLSPGDIWRVNIIVPERPDCHAAQGKVHDNLYPPVQEETHNYYAEPRPNGHRFLHSYVKVPRFGRLLIQIRDQKMAEYYRLGIISSPRKRKDSGWMRALLDDLVRDEAIAEDEFRDLLAQHSVPIVVYSEKGKRIQVPPGSTPLEVALKIHSDIFQHADYAVVNGRPEELSYQLDDGDSVYIVTDPQAHPTIDWVDYVQSPAAVKVLRAYLRKRGGDMIFRDALSALDKAGQQHFLAARGLVETELFSKYSEQEKFRHPDQLLAEIGKGNRRAAVVIKDLIKLYAQELEASKKSSDWGLMPFYLSIDTKDRVGLSDSILGPLRLLGFNVADIFPVYPDAEGRVIIVLGVDAAVLKVGGGVVGQVERLQVRTIVEQATEGKGFISSLREGDVVRYLEFKIRRLSNGLG
ncbi:MAG: HD domain-containing protein [Candidatus Margulisbacteria bacterium]|nr:HD domain-containing protein [Candidatus Margulisiibacteriota bacterium]